MLMFSNVSFGAGVTSHRFISHKSLDYIQDSNVKAMLQRNFKLYLAATMLPDMGYFVRAFYGEGRGWWGEEIHWPPFLNWLWTYNNNKCKSRGWPPTNSSECEQLWTIYFGVMSHQVGDIQWHGGYIYRFGIMESGANSGQPFSNAHSIADNMGDLPAVFLHNERNLSGEMPFDLVLTMLTEFARFRSKQAPTKADLMTTFALQEAWYVGIKAAWPVYYYFKLQYKWGHDNYFGTLGGIDNTARRLAELTDMISWENRRLNLCCVPRLESGGSWPHNTFKITKGDGSQTVDKAYHEPGYQQNPPGTYDCRWGMYLGGWRWFSYGDVSRCPFKATGDYQKSHCEGLRYWPLSCKKY